MEIKLSNGDRLTVPQGCKATVNGSEIIIEKKHEFKDGDYMIVELDRQKTLSLISADLTIPQIADAMPEYTYEQIYDTILCDYEYNTLYRKHGHLKARKVRK